MDTKERLNKMSKKQSLPGARQVYARHCSQSFPCDSSETWGGVCILIHPDVTVEQFFA